MELANDGFLCCLCGTFGLYYHTPVDTFFAINSPLQYEKSTAPITDLLSA
jgi:hypothetical protein